MKGLLCILVIISFQSCKNKIETDKTLGASDIKFIRSLGLLNDNENVIKFYSEYKKSVAGNFFTNKRISKYWIDERDATKNKICSAYYYEIKSIDTIYFAGSTYCPYMLITKTDNSEYKVCVEGTKQEIRNFFEEAISTWTKNRLIN